MLNIRVVCKAKAPLYAQKCLSPHGAGGGVLVVVRCWWKQT